MKLLGSAVIDVNARNDSRGLRNAVAPVHGVQPNQDPNVTWTPQVAPGLYTGFYWKFPDNANVPKQHFAQFYTWQAFVKERDALAQNTDYRLHSVNFGTNPSGGDHFLGLWIETGGDSGFNQFANWDDFLVSFNTSTLYLSDFDIHAASDGRRYYTGVWVEADAYQQANPLAQPGKPPQLQFISDLGFDDFVAAAKTLCGTGWRLRKIQAFPTSGPFHVTGLFEQVPGSCNVRKQDFSYMLTRPYAGQAQPLIDFQVIDDSDGTRTCLVVSNDTPPVPNRPFIVGPHDWRTWVTIWNTETNPIQRCRLLNPTRISSQIELPEPQWDAVFGKTLNKAMGYAYFVVKDGQLVARGVGNTRSSVETLNSPDRTQPPPPPFTPDTRMNIASVSKAICGIAVTRLCQEKILDIDDPFWPLLSSAFPNLKIGQGVDQVTLRNLLTMKSGLVVDQTLLDISEQNMWDFLEVYLAKDSADVGRANQNPPQPLHRGAIDDYSNTNFTILQAIIGNLMGHPRETPDYYCTYVEQRIFTPMGIDVNIFNPTPDDPQTKQNTLWYSDAYDMHPGTCVGEYQTVAAGGYVTSANQLAKLLAGLRNESALNKGAIEWMLQNNLGWYTYDGVYGQYFHHNGGFAGPKAAGFVGTQDQGMRSAIVRLTEGYDCGLMINCDLDNTVEPVTLIIQAFETRT